MDFKNLKKWMNDLYSCDRCGFCREMIDHDSGTFKICPVKEVYGFDSYTARGRNNIIQSLIEGRLELTPRLVEHVYTCLLCKNCQEHCTWHGLNINTPEIIKALRRDIVDAGMELNSLRKIDAVVEKTHNVFGKDDSEVAAWANDLDLPKKGDVLYWSGCYDSLKYADTSRSVVTIMRKAGVNLAYLGNEEWCCGAPEIANGQEELAGKLARHNIEAIKLSGAKEVIVSCAGCYHVLKSEYPKIVGELPFKVVHISEVFANLIKEGKIRFKKDINKKVTYHDPCHLGRYEGIYEAPRDTINAIPNVELVEMLRNRENAWCCGGGNGTTWVAFPKLSMDIANSRLDEARDINVNIIITSCPLCQNILSNSAKKHKDKIEVYDLSVLIAEAMELDI